MSASDPPIEPGSNASEAKPAAASSSPTQATGRQRGERRWPVGKSRTTNKATTTIGIQIESPAHAT